MTADELLAAIEKILQDGFIVLAGEITPAMQAAFRARGMEVVRQLGITTDLRGVVNREAVKYAADRAAELVRDFAETTPEMLRETVAQSLEEGWSVGKLRDALRENYAFSPVRALTIARTETAIARRRGGVIAAKAAGAKKKHWTITDDACALCRNNEAVGWIDEDEEFPEGDNPHPNCTCDIEHRSDAPADEPDEDDEDLAA